MPRKGRAPDRPKSGVTLEEMARVERRDANVHPKISPHRRQPWANRFLQIYQRSDTLRSLSAASQKVSIRFLSKMLIDKDSLLNSRR